MFLATLSQLSQQQVDAACEEVDVKVSSSLIDKKQFFDVKKPYKMLNRGWLTSTTAEELNKCSRSAIKFT